MDNDANCDEKKNIKNTVPNFVDWESTVLILEVFILKQLTFSKSFVKTSDCDGGIHFAVGRCLGRRCVSRHENFLFDM